MNENLTLTTDRYPNQSPGPLTRPKYKGVGGWLLFFCFSLTVFSPLLTIVTLITSYSEISQRFDSFPGMSVIDGLLNLGLMAVSIYAGVSLWRVKPDAVRTAKRFLWCSLAYSAALAAMAGILLFMAGLSSVATGDTIAELFKAASRGAVSFAIWFAYLNKSKRVKATFASAGV